MTVRVFGIRHHGPGSARSLGRALKAWAPDAVLIEGPPEADALLPLAAHEEMRPPVALLVYDPDQPRRAGYWPFAEFSPEWRAIRHALERGVPVRFIDLPQSHRIAERIALEEAMAKAAAGDGDADQSQAPSDAPPFDDALASAGGSPSIDGSASVGESSSIEGSASTDGSASAGGSPSADGSSSIDGSASADGSLSAGGSSSIDGSPSADETVAADGSPSPDDASPAEEGMPAEMREDPLDWLARVSGHGDGERWWEEMVEQRRGDDASLFDAIAEAMTALRGDLAMPESRETILREAFMRQQIRAAEREGFQRIAVVCGAWHVPALVRLGPAKDDAALLKGLPKAKVAATWVPWTYGRLATASGYGAGVSSPGWYGHLWESGDADSRAVVVGWLAKAARLLRSEDLDASPAQIVDAARLAESLAALRGLPIPGLGELDDAARAVFWGGGPATGAMPPQMRLIHERLVVGERLGAVPADAPAVPLQQDLARERKRLRMPAEAGERTLELDLRKEMDLERSHLLHRLVLLGVPWGSDEAVRGRKRGTFHEHWRLRWEPEMAVAVIEASVWGNTVETAADGRVRSVADGATALPPLAEMLDRVLLARLPGAARHLIARIDAEAARAADTAHLMLALPPLARALRYGSVRGGGGEVLEHVVDALVARIAIGLSAAVASLDDDAAAAMLGAIAGVHGAVTLLRDERQMADWTGALGRVAGQAGVHGAVAGRAVRLLFDVGAADADEAARRMGLALSTASDAGYAGAWVEGFLAGSGLVLLHDERLWRVLDGWLAGLEPDAFTQLLPLLRRTFATYPAAERRSLGERARRGASSAAPARAAAAADLDVRRAEAVLPLLGIILEIESMAGEGR